MRLTTEYEVPTSALISGCDSCRLLRSAPYCLPTPRWEMARQGLPGDFRQVKDGTSLNSWCTRRRIQWTVPALESGEVELGLTSWQPLPGGQSDNMLAPLREAFSPTDSHGEDRRLPGIRTLDVWEPRCSGEVESGLTSWPPLPGSRSTNMFALFRWPSSVRDSDGEDRRLPGIRTLDVREPWQRLTATLPETVCHRDSPDNVASPMPPMAASSSRCNSNSRKRKRKREPAPLQQPSHTGSNIYPPGDLPLDLRVPSTRRSGERGASVERRSNISSNPTNNFITIRETLVPTGSRQNGP